MFGCLIFFMVRLKLDISGSLIHPLKVCHNLSSNGLSTTCNCCHDPVLFRDCKLTIISWNTK